MPKAGDGPIVIAFRGTKTMSDVTSDLSIAKTGFAQQQHLDGAMAFYEDIKIKYPHREIILTGHSLGGHIATYVCLQSHLKENIPLQGISVRTFNTAPVSRHLANRFAKRPDVKSKCTNYRLSNDAISSIKFRTYFGNIFNFRSNTSNPIDAHMLWAIKEALPESVLNTPVSSNPFKILQENIQGMIQSYECRVKKQFFSSYRLGKKNLAIFLEIQKQIQPLIEKDELTEANNIIKKFIPQLISKESAKLRAAISKLIFETSSKNTGIEMTTMKKTGH
jgi:esterase/lipase